MNSQKIPKKILDIRSACLSHAEDLIRSANKILNSENLPNISYHLAVLALEEIGKSTLIVLGYLSGEREDSAWNPKKYYDDHIKKIFWAIWGPSIGQQKITSHQIDTLQGLSREIHDTRLKALYVDFESDKPLLPKDAVSGLEARNLIDAVSARLRMEKIYKYEENSKRDDKIISWFMSATSDNEKRKLIFGDKSMEKLSEFKSFEKWIDWLKEIFDEAEEEAKIAGTLELQRKPTLDLKDVGDKWKIKVRLYTNSHSIRPKPLSKWNKLDSWIKLFPVGGKKNQLIVEFTLNKNVSIHNLWWIAWGTIRRFVVALNIGTFGCFWWYVPEQISHFYEKIVDLENKAMEVKIERNPILKLDWKQGVLSESNLQNTALCFGILPADNDTELGKSMGFYITALAFLNKNDIHLQFEANAYEYFYKSLKLGMKHYNDWKEEIPFPDTLSSMLQERNLDKDEIDKQKTLAERIEQGHGRPSFKGLTISLSEVGMMKIICDAYFLLKFRSLAKQET